ncbi:MAG: protease modulator HflC [Candidatus Latescibacteria bacterium]|nr:protease modulator HflC [Candidatus Latescibacterota bacterium]
MKTKSVAIWGLILLGVIVLASGLYTVDMTEQVVITRFGKPIGDPIKEPGLKWKMPFIETVNTFEKRVLEWDGDPNQIPTKDKKYIWVDTYARWKIADPLKFFQSVRNELGAHGRLDDIIDAATRDYMTAHVLLEIVRNSNREMATAEAEMELAEEVKVPIRWGREKITRQILERASQMVPQYGIELIDVRIKHINYVEEVRRKVYERMISERTRIAEKYRSEGQGKSAEIEGKKEKELQKITSQAYRKAQEIKGKADAEAIRIYASAYNKDPEFYSFLKTLDTYKHTLDESSWLILTTDSDYLKYLKNLTPRK